MNWEHLRAMIWLRWRLMANQMKRVGTVNFVLTMIFVFGIIAAAIPIFIGSLIGGWFGIPHATPAHLMYLCDGIVFVFFIVWMISLAVELTRTEPLSLSKFLHLPMTVNGGFLINYLASLARLSIVVFVPAAAGFCLAMIAVKGFAGLFALAALVAFILMVTAATYQFQGWLASLMSNPRRRRSVIAFSLMGIMLIVQAPNLLNLMGVWKFAANGDLHARHATERANLDRQFTEKLVPVEEYQKKSQALTTRHAQETISANHESADLLEQWFLFGNKVVPLGWFPLAVRSAAAGEFWVALLAIVGMTAFGVGSLSRAYKTTVRLYMGDFDRGRSDASAESQSPAALTTQQSSGAADASSPRSLKTILLERRLPRVSEPVSAIAMGTLQSLVRAPETKMLVVTLLIMAGMFGWAIIKIPGEIPLLVRPLIAAAGMMVVLFSMLQLISNMFGFDRAGFRVYVLSPVSRRDVLHGKNLAYAFPTFGIAIVLLVVIEFVRPLRFDHLVGVVPLYVSMYLVFCLLANLIAILAPLYIPPGTFKAANPRLKTVLLQMLLFMGLFPIAQVAALAPLGIEWLVGYLGGSSAIPVFLVSSILECVLFVWLYRFVLGALGKLLHKQEQKILDIVTNR